MSTHAQTISQPDPKRWKALFLLCFANFLVMMDAALIQIALPSIKAALGYSQENLQWVMSAYLIFFGGFLLLGGRLADFFGNRRIFNLGLIIQGVSSLVAGLAWSEMSLNVSRAVQGFGSALIAPAALSMIMLLFSFNKKEMGKALAFWGLSGAAGGALGIIVGGVLTDLLNWRWPFLIYFPLCLIVLIMSPRLLQKFKSKVSEHVDYIGATLVTISLMLIVYGIVTAEHSGWGSTTILSLAIGALLFLIFIYVQSKKEYPLVPLNIFKTPNLYIGNVTVFLIAVSWFPMVYILVLYLQQILQLSPLASAMALLPMPIFMAFFMIAIAEKVMAKLGIKKTMITGFIILGLGAVLFSQTATVEGNYWTNVLLASLLASLGNALAYLPATTASVSEVESEKSGLASGLYNTNYQIGSAMGLAIMVAIAASTTNSSTVGNQVVALNEGFQQAFLWCGILAFAGAVLALIFVRSPKQR